MTIYDHKFFYFASFGAYDINSKIKVIRKFEEKGKTQATR